jgi:phytoene dehydrogenase-like protein
VGGTLEEVAASEAGVGPGEHPEKPFVLVAQQSLFDPGRAPRGKHTAWAYCHVPHGSTVNMTERIEAQIERFAPGFRQRVLARRVFSSVDLEAHTPNCVGGDIAGGANDILQRVGGPSLSLIPYATPAKGLYVCSASTPQGPGCTACAGTGRPDSPCGAVSGSR